MLAACSVDTPGTTASPVDRVSPGYSVTPGTQERPDAPQEGDTTGIDINDPSRPMFGG